MPDFIPCPTCHVRFAAQGSRLGQSVQCPNCGNTFMAMADEPIAPGEASPGSGDHWAWMFLGILTIAACGVLTLSYSGPPGNPERSSGLAVLLILATPALLRTALISYRKRKEPVAASPLAIAGTFLGSLGKALMIGVASSIAFLVPFFVFFWVALISGGIGWGNPAGTGGGGHPPAIWVYPCGVIVLVPGLALALWLFWRFFAKKR